MGKGACFFPAVMSGERFAEIPSLLRFDDKDTREARRAVDKFAPIRDLWNFFCEQCRIMYMPSPYLTVDEQLLGFGSRCPFHQYIKSKSDRYGIKLWLCADADTYYVYNLQPYLGREERKGNSTKLPVGTEVVLSLVQPLEQSSRNITCPNFFTSVQLADVLYRKKLTLLGMVRKSNCDIPDQFLASRSKDVLLLLCPNCHGLCQHTQQGSKESDATTVLPAKTGRCSQNATAVTIVCVLTIRRQLLVQCAWTACDSLVVSLL